MAWNSNGTKLASGSVDQTARVWTIEPHGHVISLPLSFKVCVFMEKVMIFINGCVVGGYRVRLRILS